MPLILTGYFYSEFFNSKWMWLDEFAIETKDFVIISDYKKLAIQEILVIMAISSNIVQQEELKSDMDL